MPYESTHPFTPQRAASRVVAVSGLLTLALFAAPNACAAAGWTSNYEYPGRGVGWYGATGIHDIRRDFAVTNTDQATDGDDYGKGYAAEFDPYGYGPPAQSTNVSRYEYLFRFGSSPVTPYRCWSDADCNDNVYCNGPEWCATGGACVSGLVPSCDDGYACTDDACDPVADGCSSTVRTSAREIRSLTLGRVAPGSSVAVLSWRAGPEAVSYGVYRSETPAPGSFACFQSGILDTSFEDDGLVPAMGSPILYLVTAVGCGAEGTAGTDSHGNARHLRGTCP